MSKFLPLVLAIGLTSLALARPNCSNIVKEIFSEEHMSLLEKWHEKEKDETGKEVFVVSQAQVDLLEAEVGKSIVDGFNGHKGLQVFTDDNAEITYNSTFKVINLSVGRNKITIKKSGWVILNSLGSVSPDSRNPVAGLGLAQMLGKTGKVETEGLGDEDSVSHYPLKGKNKGITLNAMTIPFTNSTSFTLATESSDGHGGLVLCGGSYAELLGTRSDSIVK